MPVQPESDHRAMYLIRLLIATIALFLPGCGSRSDETTLRVFLADSLARPIRALAEAFEDQHPGVRVEQVPSGSVLAARKLTRMNDQADLLAVADHLVIDQMLRPKELADWSIHFATNEIGILYTDMSRGATELTPENWFQILGRAGVKVQAANPHHDPCGYWTELCWRLADIHYPSEAGGGTIHERMSEQCGPAAERRTDAQLLLRLVESAGGVDYAFIYRSQALQHNLPFLRLPPQISLGAAKFIDTYRQVSIELPGEKKGQTVTKQGDAIIFALTIPRTAKRPELAEQFVSFLLGPRGQAILKDEHMTLPDRPWTYDPAQILPATVREHVDLRRRGDRR